MDYPSQRVTYKVAHLGRTARQVYDFVYKNPNSAKAEIREAFQNVSDVAFESALQLLRDQALVYCSSPDDESYSVVE